MTKEMIEYYKTLVEAGFITREDFENFLKSQGLSLSLLNEPV